MQLQEHGLGKTFFLDLDHEAPSYEGYIYSTPSFSYSPVTNQQILCTISQLGPHKAPGADGISNVVFIRCEDLLIPYLGPLYRATFEHSIYPKEWKDSRTIVVRKPVSQTTPYQVHTS